MDPASLIPPGGPVDVHWGWYRGLLLLMFPIHLLFMNVALGLSLLGAVRPCTDAQGRICPMSWDAARKLPTTFALAVNFGVASLLFVQVLYGQFLYTSDIIIAVFWLAVVGLIIVAYYSAYAVDFNYKRLHAGRRVLFGLSALLLLCVSFVFTNNMTLMLTPQRWLMYFDNPSGLLLNLGEPTLIPRWLHFVVPSVAVAGLAVALFWQVKRDAPGAPERINWGLRVFGLVTGLQMAVGVWFLMSLPRRVLLPFMGGEPLHTTVFALSLAGAAAILYVSFRRRVWLSAGALVFTVFCMVAMRDLVRAEYLKPYYTMQSVQSSGQYGPMIMFLAALAVGLVFVAWAVRAGLRAGTDGEPAHASGARCVPDLPPRSPLCPPTDNTGAEEG
jgi:hypothetical protein